MNLKDIKGLAEIMRDTGLTLLEVNEGETAIKLERGAVQTYAPIAPTHIAPPITGAPASELRSEEMDGKIVKSPTVGVYYSSASPESGSFVNIGSIVKEGAVLCIIEAMKLMNEITADCDGEIVEIFAGNGQVVEFGQPLFRIK